MATETWNIDVGHSTLAFAVRHMVIAKTRGRFTRWNGTIAWDAEHPERSSAVAKIEAASLETHDAQRDGHLRSPDFLDVERFPEIVFKSKKVERKGGGFHVSGDLTIHGVTQSVTLTVEAELSGDTAAVVGQAPVTLGDYGIDPPTGFSVLSIDEQGTFEFQLFFTKA